MPKCSFGEGIHIYPDGQNELDPCVYDEIERWQNVTVSVLKCRNCGHVEIAWYRQGDTVQVDLDDDASEIT